MSCGLVPWASVLCELMTPDPCYSKAIEMQKCLKANRYREGVCFEAMAVLEKCCGRWKDRSSCCMKYERLRPQTAVQPLKISVSLEHFILSELLLGH